MNIYIYYILLENRKYYLTTYFFPDKTIRDILLSISYVSPEWLLTNRPLSILKVVPKSKTIIMEDYIID